VTFDLARAHELMAIRHGKSVLKQGKTCFALLVLVTQQILMLQHKNPEISARGEQWFDFDSRTSPTRQGEKLETKKKTDVPEFQLPKVNEALCNRSGQEKLGRNQKMLLPSVALLQKRALTGSNASSKGTRDSTQNKSKK
jgi:hypothetical protein